MSSLKHLGKLFGILLGTFGVSAIFSSCAKERTCVCSYTYDNQTYNAFEITIKGECEDADPEFNFMGYSQDYDCEEK